MLNHSIHTMKNYLVHFFLLLSIAQLAGCSSKNTDPTPQKSGGKLASRTNKTTFTTEYYLYNQNSLSKVETRNQTGELLFTHTLNYTSTGQLKEIVYQDKSTTYPIYSFEYNMQGQRIKLIQNPTAVSQIYSYTYNSTGQVNRVGYALKYPDRAQPGGSTFYLLNYNKTGNIEDLTQEGGDLTMTFEYDNSFNYYADLPLPSGYSYKNIYVFFLPVTNITKATAKHLTFTNILKYDYQYDKNGRAISTTNYVEGDSGNSDDYTFTYQD